MGLPVLHQLSFSHYNEKARWALDYKGVPHVRRTAIPGTQAQVSGELTGGRTLPVLVLDEHAVIDSTAIIALLEERWPEPPLYPADAGERAHALELEEYFDEGVGPAGRRIFLAAVAEDPELLMATFMADQPAAVRDGARRFFGDISAGLKRQFGLDDPAVMDAAWACLREGGERWRSEVGPEGYLVGDRFPAAALPLAAPLGPLVGPRGMQIPAPPAGPPLLEQAQRECEESGIGDWSRTMFARHRGTSAAVAEPEA